MTNDPYDAVLTNWIVCELPGDSRFIAGKVTGDHKLRFSECTTIITTFVVSPVEAIADGNVIETWNTRYLLRDGIQVDDATLARFDAWLDAQAAPPTLGDVVASGDVQLTAAFMLRAFHTGAARAGSRRGGDE